MSEADAIPVDPGSIPGSVVFFDPYPHVMGGAQTVTLAVAQQLQHRGFDVRIVAPSDGALMQAARSEGIPSTIVPVPDALAVYGHQTLGWAQLQAAVALPKAWLRVARSLRPKPAVVHATDLRGAILAGPPARALGIPVVWHLHLTEPEPVLNWVAGLFATTALTPSREALTVMPQRVQRRGRVLHNGVPRDVLTAPVVRYAQPLVVSAARICAQKGIDVLAEAAAMLQTEVPEFRIRVYGAVQHGWEGYDAKIRQRLDDLGLQERFELAGVVDRPAHQWSEASVYVQPSRREGLPLAVVEAMATGLPVVASAVGGMTEVVEHGVTGLLVPPENPEALASALSQLLRDPARCKRMGEEGRDRVTRLYSMDSMVDQLLGLYGGLTNRRS